MQYHFDGFRTGDPHVLPKAKRDCNEKTDVLIIGCGPAGLTLAAQLAQFPDISTRIVERKSGPLEMGQADGIACRSMEMFAAFGFADKVKREAYWVNETCFWRPDDQGQLHRADRILDVEDGLSEMPHVILSQARVHDFYLELMDQAPTRLEPEYDTQLVSFSRDDHASHPVLVTLEHAEKHQTLRCKYLVGCDGARSVVRRGMGLALQGESARQLWGVMDVLAVTDFPDIRLKTAVQSAHHGSLLIIPREGGALVRCYIELGELHGDERAADRAVTAQDLTAQIQKVLAPYHFDVREVPWCSAYEIGQRVCPEFDDAGTEPDGQPRVFIAGDACHTHSPKAGQGMNVSMADTFNLGWKLAAVLRGQAGEALLHSYTAERHAKAQELIDFDKDMARLFSERGKDAQSAARFQQYFQKHGRYTAGVETRYDPSEVIGTDDHQARAKGFVIGKRFHSAPVVRLADAKPMELAHCCLADGRWRLFLFADDQDAGQGKVAQVCNAIAPFVAQLTPEGSDADAALDIRAVFQRNHRDLSLSDMPKALLPVKGTLRLTDYEKLFCPARAPGPDIFDLRGIDRSTGAAVLVRPDQFVALIAPLNGMAEVAGFMKSALALQD